MTLVKVQVCRCAAYKFPHRPGGGDCTDPGDEPECGECNFSITTSDPYATGDHWHSLTECNHPRECPWGKE